jgi:hypothetical protein
MSSNQVIAEKLCAARRIVGMLNKQTESNSLNEDMLEFVWETLDDAVAQLLPAPDQKLEEIKEVTIKPARDASVCPCPLFQSCDACKKFLPRKRTWTAEQKAEHSAKVKASLAAKKAKATGTPLKN